MSVDAAKLESSGGVVKPESGPSEREIAISIEGLSFTYGTGVEAVRALTLTVGRGKRLGIVGPSGCGKSTVLALIAGLKEPTTGRVTLNRYDSARHPLAMVFQKDTLLPWLTVRDNIGLFHKLHGLGRRATRERVSALVTMGALDAFEDAYPYQLSGGMRRRVAFLSAVAAMPEILLMDEPFASLDEPTRVAIHQEIHQVMQQIGMTMILVTHDLAEAISLCDEVVIFTGRPGTVFARRVVPFSGDRDILALRQEPEFLNLYGALWQDLAAQLSSPGAEATPGLSTEERRA